MATVPEFELKVLQAVHVLERDKGLMPAMSHELLTYLPEEGATEVIQALGRLWRAGYVEGKNEPTMNEPIALIGLKLTERGLREVESWPAEPSLAALLTALQEAEEATDDEDERRGLQRMREGAKRLSLETVMTLYRSWVTHLGGPGALTS